MDQKTGLRLFTKRNILGAVLVAGIVAGVYLGDFLKGPGLGGSGKQSPSDHSKDGRQETSQTQVTVDSHEAATNGKAPVAPRETPQVVKVLIADRSYYLRSPGGDEHVDLKDLVSLVRSATGDEDGIRVRIYRKLSSRTAAEIALRDALADAGIPDEQTVWIVNPVDD